MRFSIIFILFSSIYISSKAQVVIYDSTNNVESTTNADYFRIKIDLWEPFVVGTLKIYVEKNLNDNFSLEAGAGMTHLSLMNLVHLEKNTNNFIVKPNSINGNNNISSYYYIQSTDYKFKPGFAFSIFPKYYFDDNDNGSYIGIEGEYKLYRFGVNSTNGAPDRSQHLGLINLSINYGGVNLNDNETHTDYQIGVGFTLADDVRYTTYDENSTVTFNKLRPLLKIGIRWSFLQL